MNIGLGGMIISIYQIKKSKKNINFEGLKSS